jgi:drug/metabolite transporter (DMT)-like permease
VSRRGWVLFVAMSLIWGIPYLLIKVAVESVTPPVVVFVRVALAAAILLPLALWRGMLGPLRPYWRWVVVIAFVEIAIPFGALTFAETRLTSSLTALLIAAVPIVGAVIAHVLHLDDRLTRGRLLGLLLGIVGVAALVGLDVTGSQLIGVAALCLTVIGYAFGPMIIATKLAAAPAPAVIAVAMSINAVVYAPVALATWPTTPVPAKAWWCLVVLGLLCTAIAFLVFFALVAEAGPTRTTVITYVNPAVAVLLGVAVLDEPVTLGIVLGFPLILVGSYLATRRVPVLEEQPRPA